MGVPKNLLIYYGWLNSFNSAKNAWANEAVAQDLAKYDVLVFGDGIQDPYHGDYANTTVIISRVKVLNPDALIFGYVTTNQDYSVLTPKVHQWDTLQVHGIFFDEAGYDYGKTRTEFNQRVDYVHGMTYARLCIANAWNSDHVLGTVNDSNFPNSTYNPSSVASSLNSSDFILLESFPVNTGAYVEGYESASDWKIRGEKSVSLFNQFGVNFISSSVIDNNSVDGGSLCAFAYTSAIMFGIKYFGTSDTSYGSNSAAVRFWARPGIDLSSTPAVYQDPTDTSRYGRTSGDMEMVLKFTSGQQKASIFQDACAYGSLVAPKVSQVVALTTTAAKFTAFNSAGPNSNIGVDASTDKFTVKVPGVYKAYFELDALVSTARDVEIAVRKNGTEMSDCTTKTRQATTLSHTGFSNYVTVSAGDTLEIYLSASGSTNMTVWNARFLVEKKS